MATILKDSEIMEQKEAAKAAVGLDKILAKQDAKLKYIPNLKTSNGKGKPRQSFDSGLPKEKTSFARLTFGKAFQMFKVMPFLMLKMFRSGNFYKKPFLSRTNEASPEFFEELEYLAKQLGAKDIGYVRNIPDSDIFNDLGIPHRHAIVFTVEMDKEQIEKSPGFESFIEVAKGYKSLATISNKLAKFMNKRGFAAYPGTALGGLTDYVSLAQRAGLGEIGYNGLLLSTDAGPRVRINTIYTNIENLPQRENKHAWVRDFCSQCQNCIRSCPAGAIYREAKPRATGGKISIEYKSCLNYFARDWGCAVCIKVCPFSSMGYEKVKQEFEQMQVQKTNELPPASTTEARKVAVVGAGAAGFYLTEALLEQTTHLQVDLLDKMPIPFGLVRYGVAPDHPVIKTKIYTFESILLSDRVRFFGNITLGKDLTKATLLEQYDAVVFATGASEGKSLKIKGESLKNCIPAPDFIYWYNAHPAYKSIIPNLQHSAAAIIGMGNVSLDAARMLVKSPDVLNKTDMAPYAVEAFKKSKVRDIHIIGRRGPSQANFTPKELIELQELPDVVFVVQAKDIAADVASPSKSGLEQKRAQRNLEIFAQAAKTPVSKKAKFRIHFHFFCSPKQILGHEVVEGIELEENQLLLVDNRLQAQGTQQFKQVEVGLILKSVGYRSSKLPDVAYDEKRGIIPNKAGRVLDEKGAVIPREHTSGWVRRGATGVIGTNKKDAVEVAANILEDLQQMPPATSPRADLAVLLAEKQASFVDKEGLRHLMQQEKHHGSSNFRAALKFDNITEMLAVAAEKID